MLGQIRVVEQGEVVTIGSGREVRVLASLLLRPGEVVSLDALVDALWGERPPRSARNAVQVQIHSLRTKLGRDRLTTEASGYRLRVEPGELDSDRFERLAAQGRGQLAAGKAELAAATLAEALALWRGTPFAEVAYERFVQDESGRLEELRLSTDEARIEAELALGRHDVLVAELESLVAAHPAREHLQAQLMLALYRAGRQRDALAVFRRSRTRLRDELGVEPGPELRELQRAILRHDESLRVEPAEVRARRHLPVVPTPLVGRRRELREIAARLIDEDGSRLVTLTGTGGVGKTRLAIELGHDLAGAFDDGVYFVDLTYLRDPGLVVPAIAEALGVEEHSGTPLLEVVQAHLRRRRVLVVADNFEVVEEAGPELTRLLEAAPGLVILVTSRTPLRLRAEQVVRVAPLPLRAAVRLFADRARAVAPPFRRPDVDAADVAAICRRVDRLPLAIELAAARTRDYAPGELLELFPGRLELAGDGARDLPRRHRTLRATIDWSFELLAEDERTLLTRLSVFAGGFTVAAAEAVCSAGRSSLATLVHSSLVHEHLGATGEPRYVMLPTIREYVRGRLPPDDEEAVGVRHAAYYLALAESAEPEVVGETQREWLATLDDERDNLREALDRSFATGAWDTALRLATGLVSYWILRGHFEEGRARLETALANERSEPLTRARGLSAAARLAHSLGRYEEMEAELRQARSIYSSLGDDAAAAWTLNKIGTAIANRGDVDRGRELLEESVALLRELDDLPALGSAVNALGVLQLLSGDPRAASRTSTEALALFTRMGRRDATALALCNIGLADLSLDRPGNAVDHFLRAIGIAFELAYSEALAYALVGLAAGYAALSQAERASTLIGAVETGVAAAGITLEPLEQQVYAETVRSLETALGDGFAPLRASGARLSLVEAAAQVLEDASSPDSRTPQRRARTRST